MPRGSVVAAAVIWILTQAHPACAVWTPDGIPLGPPRTAQIEPRIVPDGTGGSIMVWEDTRSCASTADVYAQRFDATGHALWGTDGVPVATAVGAQAAPQVVSDMAGGAILFWQDNRGPDTDIYGQRLSPTGASLWAPDGIPICTAPDYQDFGQPYTHAAISDGSGGAYVVWQDERTSALSGIDLYIQHVKDSGVTTLPLNGLPLSTAPGGQLTPAICSDGSGGAIVAWSDDRVGDGDIYAQRVIATGTVAWTTDGVPVCTAAGIAIYSNLVGDGTGGAIVTWEDGRGTSGHIYAQRISATGAAVWSPIDGLNLSPVSGDQLFPQIVTDGVGGAIIAFTDRSIDPAGDIHAQRVNGSGALLWAGASGVTICDAAGEQDVQPIVADGTGGAVVTWTDRRSGSTDVYTQRVSPSGAPLWTPSAGVVICAAPSVQEEVDVASDGAAGAILTWTDHRSGYVPASFISADIYARRVSGGGVALWDPDGDIVSAPGAAQRAPAITVNPYGDALFAWEDYRTGCIGKIYAQALDPSGNSRWGVDGGAIAGLGTGSQQGPKICPDGFSGGAYVVWTDFRSGNADIYAQHIDRTPGVYWSGGDALGVCVDPSPQITPNIVACESGGAIIVWDDQRGGANVVYAQKLLDTGAIAPGWPTDGMPVVTATNATELFAPQVVSDGADGCIVTWQDRRGGTFDIYAQRIDAGGARRWVISGLLLCGAAGDQTKPQIVSDGAGGAIVTWEDNRAGNADVYARRVDATGTPLWAVDGVPVYADASAQTQPVIASDGAGGAIVSWRDARGGTLDVYAQRLNASGVALWPTSGVAVCAGPGPQQDPAIVPDGAHGAVIAWRDGRSGEDDIYAQRLDGTGAPHCGPCGVGMCTATAQQYQNVLAPDGVGGAIVAWTDLRSTRADDIEVYASRFTPECGSYAAGVDDTPASGAVDRLIQNRPNPFNPTTVISYTLAAAGHVTVNVYDLAGRRVRTLVDASQGAGPQRVMWNGDLDSGERAASGPYFYRVTFPDGTSSAKKMMLLR